MKTAEKLFCLLFILIYTTAFAQDADRSQPPSLEKPKPLTLPEIQEFTLSNGLKVVLMEKHDVPLVQVNVTIYAGRVNDPENKTGLATMTADMLDEGAGGMDALQLADAIDFLGANISTGAGYHSTEAALHTPLSKLDEAIKLLSDVVLRPSFPEKELERLKKARLTSLIQWHDQPSAIASALFAKSLYGEKHPYGKTSIGSESEIRSLTVNDLREYYSEYFNATNAFIVVVGDITKDDVQPKLESAFGSWKKGEAKNITLGDAVQVEQREIILVDKPGSAQSVIQIGRIGAARDTEDYFPIIVMNTILGGSFSSRLNQNIREEHGYSYGAGSYFSFRPFAGPTGASSSVQTEVTDSSLYEFFKELNGIHEVVPDDELEKAKNYVALGYPRDFQTVEGIANQLSDMIMYNLPSDYFNNYVENVLSVTKDEVAAAANKYIVPDKVVVVVVGDREKIEQGIKGLNLGNLKVLSIEDVLGKVPVMIENN